jgi:hypothetical protein
MSADAAAGHFAALVRLGVRPEGVHIGGGEPFLRFDHLLDVLRAAREAGLDGVGYVETSGFWATDPELARHRLAQLAAAGMRQLSVSADPYHQEFVPPERVRLLVAASREVLGPGGLRVRRWKWAQSPRDVAAMPEPDRLALFAALLTRYPERMTGRAADELAPLVPHVPPDALPRDGCRNALLEAGHVHVDPGGWAYPGTCAGIVMGRASAAAPLDAVLAAWSADPPPLVRTLIDKGPTGLLAEAEALGFVPSSDGYAGKCHLCWSIRRQMAAAGASAEVLQPANLYLTS